MQSQGSSSILRNLRRFDAYPKTLEDFRVKTYSGACVTLVSSVIMMVLFLSELNYYLSTEMTEELLVDVTRGQKLRINFDLVYQKVPCSLLSTDAIDVSGVQQINVVHNIMKRRIDSKGNPLQEAQKEELGKESADGATKVPDKNVTLCGSCYGAETPQLNCCQTCEQVREAYSRKGWATPLDMEQFEQCKREGWQEKVKLEQNEGCQVFGYLEVNRVAGNFHVAPGKSYQQHHVHVHDLQPFSSSEFNLSHTINHLSFGESIPGKSNPLDGVTTIAEKGAMMYQYYVKIVPTTYVKADGKTVLTNQYSVTRHQKVVGAYTGEQGLPGTFFIYELSPMMVKYTEKNKSFTHFLTGVCAIIGGVFTVAGLVDSVMYHSARLLQAKIEIGKVN